MPAPVGDAAVMVSAQLDGREVILGGAAFGVKVYASGIMVVGIPEIETDDSAASPAYGAGVRIKDIIIKADGTEVKTVEQLAKVIDNCGGQAVSLTVARKGEKFETPVTPVKAADGHVKIEMWARGSTAGIGTITFYDPQTGVFGGLGHAICNVDMGEIVPIEKGAVVGARIIDIRKGQKGAAGELVGIFDDSVSMGTLFSNGKTGVFGQMEQDYEPQGELVEVALKTR